VSGAVLEIGQHPIAAAIDKLKVEGAPTQADAFCDDGSPVMVAYGAGVDSTAMVIEMVEAGIHIDVCLFADTGSEKPATYEYLEIFRAWLAVRGVRLEVVQYQPSNFKNFPAYRGLDENCFTNGTLPSISFGFSSCSQKYKVAPQNKWTEAWAAAASVWKRGGKVIKLIGYDCSPADQKRYAHAEGYQDERFLYCYPLRELGWKREDCIARIEAAGLPVPAKSACYMCGSTKPLELHDYPPHLLRRIVLMEARAAPRLVKIEGLWRNGVKGTRGGVAKPGKMTDYIRAQGLLPADEIDLIAASAPEALVSWQAAQGSLPIADRPPLASWLGLFDLLDEGAFGADFLAGVQVAAEARPSQELAA
jgi:hypothetical protein